MTVRQRIIWMTDEEWAAFGDLATLSGVTKSRLVLELLSPYVAPTTTQDVPRATPEQIDTGRARLSIGKTPSGDTFATFRPAPKPGKR